jgi:hypothetical protein
VRVKGPLARSYPAAVALVAFALIELLRGVAAFVAAPLILHFAKTVANAPARGTQEAMWLCFAVAIAGALAACYVFLLGRPPLCAPKIERWLDGEEAALPSPPLGAALRRRRTAV